MAHSVVGLWSRRSSSSHISTSIDIYIYIYIERDRFILIISHRLDIIISQHTFPFIIWLIWFDLIGLDWIWFDFDESRIESWEVLWLLICLMFRREYLFWSYWSVSWSESAIANLSSAVFCIDTKVHFPFDYDFDYDFDLSFDCTFSWSSSSRFASSSIQTLTINN
jgi:hypothetical protein